MTATDYYNDRVEALRAEGNLRVIPRGDAAAELTDLSSNDYLGLAAREDLRREFFASPGIDSLGLTSSASRLLAAGQTSYTILEDTLSRLYGRQTLLFNSGYHANTGIVSALGQAPHTLIVADRLVHASIIDGITLSRAPFTRFRHNDMAHLESILTKERDNYDRFLVITESIFSMDGDSADTEALIDLRERHKGVILYVDEAHAVGCSGPDGLGLSMSSPRRDKIDVIIGTFGKACASVGAFAAVSPSVREYLVNTSRSLIFSTALPPLNVAWTSFLMSRLPALEPERRHLRDLGEHLRDILVSLGAPADLAPSHIQPLIVGDPRRAVALSQALLARGFKALPIRVPTVPRGTDRLRLSLSAALTHDDLDRFGTALREVLNTSI